MHKTTLALASILLIGSLAATQVSAAEKVTVKAGQKTLIYQFATFESNCASGQYPKFKAKKTKNGSLTTTRGSFLISDGRCKGKRLKSTNVYYTPETGFRGKDRARLSFGTPVDSHTDWGLKYTTVTMSITVE